MIEIQIDLGTLERSAWHLMQALVQQMTKTNIPDASISRLILEARGESYDKVLELSTKYVVIKPKLVASVAK
jgi:hypothetical protein